MKRERRLPTRREWEQTTSMRPAGRRIPNAKAKPAEPEEEAERLDRIATEALNAHLEDEDTYRRWERAEELLDGGGAGA